MLLGHFRGRVCFAADLRLEGPPSGLPAGMSFEDLRLAGGQIPADEAGLLAYARAMVLWRRRHRHCGNCGAPTASASAGHVMKCTQHDLRRRTLSATRSRDHRAGHRRRAGAARSPGRLARGPILHDRRVRRARREPRGRGRARGARGNRRDRGRRRVPLFAAVAVPVVADDRLHRRAAPGAVARADEELEDVRWFTRERDRVRIPRLAPAAVGVVPPHRGLVRLGIGLPLRQTPA